MGFMKKLIEKLEEEKGKHFDRDNPMDIDRIGAFAFDKAIDVVRGFSANINDAYNGWIPCSERMPEVETEVLILAKRKYKNGKFKFIITTAMHEDGTIRENDSCWRWDEIEGEWDEEEDCYILPEGWWENRHYNPDEVYNNIVDDEVIAWMPLPEPHIGRME